MTASKTGTYFSCRALLWATAVASWLTFSTAALAESSSEARQSDQRALAETLFFAGKGLMVDGRVGAACLKFAESYRLDPAAGTLLNLAVCHEREGKSASAWGEFHQALDEAKRAARPERVALASAAIARIEPELAYVSIVVPKESRVPGLEIQRNGIPLLEGGWSTALPIDPGPNEVSATAPLCVREAKTFRIEARQHMTLTIEPLELTPVERPPPPFWTGQRKLGAALVGGGVVAAGVGAVFGAMALSSKKTSDSECPFFDGERRCSPAGASAMSNAQTDVWVADIGVGIGAAAILVGGYLFATGYAHDEATPAHDEATARPSSWSFRVVSGASGATGVLSHSF